MEQLAAGENHQSSKLCSEKCHKLRQTTNLIRPNIYMPFNNLFIKISFNKLELHRFLEDCVYDIIRNKHSLSVQFSK